MTRKPGGSSDPTAVLAALAGTWSLRRRICPGGRLIGRAVFAPAGPGHLHYREDGGLRLETGAVVQAFRDYDYRARAGAVRVDFADGEHPGGRFLRLEFAFVDGHLRAADRHLCGADIYDACYRLLAPDRFAVRIRVTGPAKDCRIWSVYRRLAGPAVDNSRGNAAAVM